MSSGLDHFFYNIYEFFRGLGHIMAFVVTDGQGAVGDRVL